MLADRAPETDFELACLICVPSLPIYGQAAEKVEVPSVVAVEESSGAPSAEKPVVAESSEDSEPASSTDSGECKERKKEGKGGRKEKKRKKNSGFWMC